MQNVRINTDGGARGNPGPAAVGVVMVWGERERSHGRTIGDATNNYAEYMAVIDALEILPEFLDGRTPPRIDFFLDSQLVVKQIMGEYRVKEPVLQTLCKRVKDAVNALGIPATFTHIPRAQNAAADALVNKALDAR